MAVEQLITDHIDIWSSALKTRSSAGRGSSKKLNLHGIKKLRELILELAVRGLLVPQDPSDEPASVLLEKIVAEKSRLVEEKKIKKQKSLPEIGADEKPFELPVGWEWVRLQDVSLYIQRGKGPKYDENGKVKVVSQKCVQWSGFNLDLARYVNDASLEKYQEERYLQSNDLLWNSTGAGTVGRVNVLPEISCKSLVADSHVTVIRLFDVNRWFIWSYLSAPGIQHRIEPDHENALVSGSTKQVELNTSSVVSLEVPIPPLAEQHRIVTKVNELMTLCDQLEQQQETSITAHQTLVETLLNALVETASHTQGEEGCNKFQQAWQRIADHFDTLFTTEHSIQQLKQTILQLAVMGKLVPQDPNDEPASALLEKIATEKARLVEEKKIKKQKPLPEIGEDEKPFGLPVGWEWVYLSELLALVTDGDHQAPPKSDSGIPFLVIGNLNTGKVTFDNCRYVPQSYFDQLDWGRKPKDRDLLYTVTGSYGIPIKVKAVDDFCVQRHVAILKSVDSTPVDYLALLTRSHYAFEYATKIATGIAQKTVPLTGLRKMPIAVPPKSEEARIVTKVNELMTLCDNMLERIKAAQTTQLNLTDAIVEQAIG